MLLIRERRPRAHDVLLRSSSLVPRPRPLPRRSDESPLRSTGDPAGEAAASASEDPLLWGVGALSGAGAEKRMTRDYLMRLLRKEDRDSRNQIRRLPRSHRYDRGYFLGRAHAASALLRRLQLEPRRAKKEM